MAELIARFGLVLLLLSSSSSSSSTSSFSSSSSASTSSASAAAPRSCLAAQSRLSVLDLTANRISRLGPAALAPCGALEDLWLGYNRLGSFEALALPRLREACPRLATLYLEHCPVARDFEYRMALARALPQLRQIDADAIPGRR